MTHQANVCALSKLPLPSNTPVYQVYLNEGRSSMKNCSGGLIPIPFAIKGMLVSEGGGNFFDPDEDLRELNRLFDSNEVFRDSCRPIVFKKEMIDNILHDFEINGFTFGEIDQHIEKFIDLMSLASKSENFIDVIDLVQTQFGTLPALTNFLENSFTDKIDKKDQFIIDMSNYLPLHEKNGSYRFCNIIFTDFYLHVMNKRHKDAEKILRQFLRYYFVDHIVTLSCNHWDDVTAKDGVNSYASRMIQQHIMNQYNKTQ